MIKGASIHLVLALLWTFLGTPSWGRFIAGAVIVFVILAAFQSLLDIRSYIRRSLAFVKFLFVFTREFLLSNLNIARAVLTQKREDIVPDFIEYDITGLRPQEVLLLSQCITLTPGTTSVEISPDFSTLVIHAFDAKDPEAVCRGIDSTLRKAILEFTR